MSLKAKIEAVIYAAEEPVTLAQLSAVFASEILAQLTQELAESAEVAAADAADADAAMANGETTDNAALLLTDENEPEAGVAVESATDDHAAQATLPAAEASSDEGSRLARQRDRQVRVAVERWVGELMADYASDERGMEIREIAGGYRMATKAQYHDGVRAFVKRLKPVMKLSLQALETLAVVAYKQPVTAPEISEIRGVDSGGVLGSLIGRKLIATAGRKQVVGRPILYKTTKEFLLRFGLKDVNDLPSIEEFEKMAAEMVDAEAVDSSLHQPSEAESDAMAEQGLDAAGSDAGGEMELTEEIETSEAMEETQP